MTPADMKAIQAFVRALETNDPGAFVQTGPFDETRVCIDGTFSALVLIDAVLSAYGLDRDKANGLASDKLKIKRATRKEGE